MDVTLCLSCLVRNKHLYHIMLLNSVCLYASKALKKYATHRGVEFRVIAVIQAVINRVHNSQSGKCLGNPGVAPLKDLTQLHLQTFVGFHSWTMPSTRLTTGILKGSHTNNI